MKIRAHKFGSVVSRLNLEPEVEISRMVEARSGQVVVVRALEEKRVYDQLELTSGRMAHVGKGDVIGGFTLDYQLLQNQGRTSRFRFKPHSATGMMMTMLAK